ncbi:hypothetical protein LZC95_06610 [Pendulispora brunnea]|uniref:Uncharacterized protein n=1 Tax=Pendulispora brunnea TaxID=2905690 RepID=A0ABZ2KCW3_9BACT
MTYAMLRRLAPPILVLLAAVPLVAHAMRARRDENALLAQMARFEALPVAHHAENGRFVTLNGSRVFFRTSSTQGSLAGAVEGIGRECRSGDRAMMLGGEAARDDGPSLGSDLQLERVDRQETDNAAAVLCVFRQKGDTSRVRYSMVKRADGGRTSIITVATDSAAPLETLFPAEGDAPGGDFDGVPRPPGSRRTFAATLDGEAYGVRVYEVKRALPDSVGAYDDEMRAQGWSRSEAVAERLPDARVYTRGPVKMVASFESGPDGSTTVAIAPLATP